MTIELLRVERRRTERLRLINGDTYEISSSSSSSCYYSFESDDNEPLHRNPSSPQGGSDDGFMYIDHLTLVAKVDLTGMSLAAEGASYITHITPKTKAIAAQRLSLNLQNPPRRI
jgi:hypothetical protein